MQTKKPVNDLIDSLVKTKTVTVHVTKETSIVEKLEAAGLQTSRVVQYLRRNVESDREILEMKKDSMPKEEYYKEKLMLNEAEVLLLYLESSL